MSVWPDYAIPPLSPAAGPLTDGQILLRLAEFPITIALGAVILELLLPIPSGWRLSACTPIFRLLAAKVNRPENSAMQCYFAGILLPLLIIAAVLAVLVLIESTIGFDRWLGLLVLPFLLESRPALRLIQPACVALQRGDKAEARARLAAAVQRDTAPLSAMGVAKAGSEAMIMRLFTGWFAVIIWYLILGLHGAVLMQLTVTLARAFNVKFPENHFFGVGVYRIEHGLLLPPLAVLTLCLLCSLTPFRTLRAGFQGARELGSFVPGFLYGALGCNRNVSLGGPRYYRGELLRLNRVGGLRDPDAGTPLKLFYRLVGSGLGLLCILMIAALTRAGI